MNGEQVHSDPLAVVGIGCRFPSARGSLEFWRLLSGGQNAITEVPADRWDVDAYYDPDPRAPGKSYSRWGGFVDRVDHFDAAFFGISPREAIQMDPRQRILLETAWKALEHAGQAPERLSGSNTGVFIGHMVGDYYALQMAQLSGVDSYVSTGNLDSILANRLSYVLNLHGPSLAVDTACSSALVALYLACQSLRQHESDVAIAGGINLMLSPEMHVMGAKSLLLSREGRCRTFDRGADGFVRGEGCGLMVLKRLDDALAAHDNVLAVIRGIAINQDGRTNGISAPNGLSQQRVIRRALRNAQVEAERVTFVETHGTGTVVGDTIEFEALAEVYGAPSDAGSCRLGAVKTNIGHLEGAAGAAGIIKMVLSMQHRVIPPNLNCTDINPHLEIARTRFELPRECEPWTVTSGRRLGGVSSFGLGGTNAHVILEEAPEPLAKLSTRERPLHVMTLSARDDEALGTLAHRYALASASCSESSLCDIAYSANTGRSHFAHRTAIVANDLQSLRAQLGSVRASHVTAPAPQIAFLFSGLPMDCEGELYATQPVFRRAVDDCRAIRHDAEESAFVVEYALASLWQSWGIRPAMALAHGESACVLPCLTGEIGLDEALALATGASEASSEPLARRLQRLQSDGCNVFLEIGPRPLLIDAGRGALADHASLWLASLDPEHSQWRQMLDALAALYTRGVEVDWLAFDLEYPRKRVPLPTYPFRGQRFWLTQAPEWRRDTARMLRPLVSTITQSPLVNETVVATPVSIAGFPWLADHRVFDEVVAPGAFFVSMMLNAADLLGHRSSIMCDVQFVAPLPLSSSEERVVQAVLSPGSGASVETGARFQIISLPGKGSPEKMITHVTGELREGSDARAPMLAWAEIQARCHSTVDPEATARKDGVELGPAFRWTDQAWLGDGECLALLRRPDSVDVANDWLHPGLLDACFEVAGATRGKDATSGSMLPRGFKRLESFRSADGDAWWCHARQTAAHEWDITLAERGGRQLLRVQGFEMRPASRVAMLKRRMAGWLYQLEWQPQPITGEVSFPGGADKWLIIADDASFGEQLAARLRAHGEACVVATAPPAEPMQWQGVVHLVEADDHLPDSDVPNSVERASVRALHTVQALLASTPSTRLWLVTRGAQTVTDGESVRVTHAPLWGLARTLLVERPDLKCVSVDLPSRPESDDVDGLVDELTAAGDEAQVALRAKLRYVARLVSVPAETNEPSNEPVKLQLTEYGSPDNLRLTPLSRRAPGRFEVEIEVRACALNLRDVLIALGMLKDHYALSGIHRAEDVPLGFDCAGIVASVGAGIQDLSVGQLVMAPAAGSCASFVTVPRAMVVPMPARLTFDEASALPTVFLTAHHALLQLARLKRGDRVLIHAAAGGVGQAAVQLAQMVGAELFVTASPDKWQFLQAQGVTHVMNSRTLDFVDEVMRLTGGQGVDVVLNGLSGDAIEASFSVLKHGGRFVEIGKLGIRDEAEVRRQRPDVSYFVFDFDDATGREPELIRSTLGQVVKWFEQGELRPLPQTVFPVQEVVAAYRYVQQARQIGKVVLQFGGTPAPAVRADGSYLITGGLGALGLAVAGQLVRAGARHLVLAGRRAGSGAGAAAVAALRAAGAAVDVVQADVAEGEAVAQLLAVCQAAAPLRGIVHAAGVLDDGVVERQTAARVARVLAPKVRGAWHLHAQTAGVPLDFFVCFSSMASLVGSPGQSSYAAANAFLDGLAHHRRAAGLPGLSINWGPWADAGMAAGLRSRLESQGEGMIDPALGTRIFSALLGRTVPQVGVMRIDWARFRDMHPQPAVGSLLLGLGQPAGRPRTSRPSAPEPNISASLRAAPIERRKSMVEDLVQSHVAQVLGHRAGAVPRTRGFLDMGFDSLTATELGRRLQRELDCSLPATLTFDYPTVESLVTYLVEQAITADIPDQPLWHSGAPVPDDPLDLLSRDEIAALLAQELEALGEGRSS